MAGYTCTPAINTPGMGRPHHHRRVIWNLQYRSGTIPVPFGPRAFDRRHDAEFKLLIAVMMRSSSYRSFRLLIVAMMRGSSYHIPNLEPTWNRVVCRILPGTNLASPTAAYHQPTWDLHGTCLPFELGNTCTLVWMSNCFIIIPLPRPNLGRHTRGFSKAS